MNTTLKMTTDSARTILTAPTTRPARTILTLRRRRLRRRHRRRRRILTTATGQLATTGAHEFLTPATRRATTRTLHTRPQALTASQGRRANIHLNSCTIERITLRKFVFTAHFVNEMI